MSKQQSVSVGDKFRDTNGETYTVIAIGFGDQRTCSVEGGEDRCVLEMRCKQLRAMTRV